MSDDSKMPINVSYGPNTSEFQVPVGSTVASILKEPYIKEIIGFQGGDDEIITVIGKVVDDDYVLMSGDRLEVIKPAGEKA
jgi:sulfur carrier protein ThiS